MATISVALILDLGDAIVTRLIWSFVSMEIIFRRKRKKTKKQEAKQKSAATCAPPRATQHELQSDLQLAATCAGLGGAQVRPNCKPVLAPARAGPGVIRKRYGAH